jgi:hypothetical protein
VIGVRRSVTVVLLATVALLAACASTEGLRLESTAPASPEAFARVRDQLELRLAVLRPGTDVRVEGEALVVGMPPAEASPLFLQRLLAPGRLEIVAVVQGEQPPTEGDDLDLAPLIPSELVLSVAPADEPGGTDALDIVLDGEGATRLRDWTAANIGGALAVVVDDVVVSVPTVAEAITGAELRIASGSAGSEAFALAALVAGTGPLAVDLVVEAAGSD